jgi:SPP1 gp7 family putative phage head morphogenesis protein
VATLYDQAEAFRADVLRRERVATLRLIDAYADIWRELRIQVDVLMAEMPTPPDIGWLLRQQRYQDMLSQVEAAVRTLAPSVADNITAAQADLVQAAQAHSAELARLALGPEPVGAVALTFNRVPEEALQVLIGQMQDGLLLRYKLAELAPDVLARIRKALITGVGTGQGPDQIARGIQDALGGNMQKAITIARTETMYAYRESSRQFFLANDQVVKGWVWLSRRSRRTCSACLAMDGSFHSNDEPFGSHQRCACIAVPQTKTWAELGYDIPDHPQDLGTGAAAFAKFSATDQEHVLGKAKYEAYRDGKITLADTVLVKDDPHWGVTRSVASLDQSLANAASA